MSWVITSPAWTVLLRPTPSARSSGPGSFGSHAAPDELVWFDAKPARLNSEERSRPEGLFEQECLVLNEPVGEWRRAVRPTVMANQINRLEGTKDVQCPEPRFRAAVKWASTTESQT